MSSYLIRPTLYIYICVCVITMTFSSVILSSNGPLYKQAFIDISYDLIRIVNDFNVLHVGICCG